jgi:hypothetical protein
VPGYEPERFLGAGAYGEVWVARERNTGRRVAIKFYAHRSGLDWSLLSREVEKLAFLFADRYVVQLLKVGWDAEPPYYVMEYLERGSLADRLQEGPLPVEEALEVFRDVAVGLVHAHGKGVLHCDLKPGNILLDQDHKARMADFGQSRLSHEQLPALGTLFYMAPEQADLEAVPDARWDVYALGALLYCMLTGRPPHQTQDLIEQFERTPQLAHRLTRYRRLIEESPPPSAHRQVRGVDRALADIIDRCLAVDPEKRFPNSQAVLDVLHLRKMRRARRPLMVLGAVGPALLLLVVTWFAWQGFSTAIERSDEGLTERALEGVDFAALYVARSAAGELARRFRAVEDVASSRRFRRVVAETVADPEMARLLEQLSDPNLGEVEPEELREQFRRNLKRKELQRVFAETIPPEVMPDDGVASWFFCDARGISMVRVPESLTIGKNFAWRSYFHGGPRDCDESWRPTPEVHLEETMLSAVFRSQATYGWIIAVSTPVYRPPPDETFLGVVALTIEVGRVIEFERHEDEFAVLVDRRPGDHTGMILQHPLYDKLLAEGSNLPDRFKDHRVPIDELRDRPQETRLYDDPMAQDPKGAAYRKPWLARLEPIRIRGQDSGLVAIVQKAYESAIGSTLEQLKAGLVRHGVLALLLVGVIIATMWAFAVRLSATR